MPIYEYTCENCGTKLEKLQKVSDLPLQDCVACGEPKLKKLVSATAFRLKGQGWYETDFKSSKQKNLHENGGKSSGDGANSKNNTSTSQSKSDTSSDSGSSSTKKAE